MLEYIVFFVCQGGLSVRWSVFNAYLLGISLETLLFIMSQLSII
ncbi:hypothetical protein HPCPY1313_1331 [Helicobacter pylori CPY1313]|nr:hypothetical protein HPCPY1313_1331 [Helicobacter pylori CPY1313]